MRLLSFMFLIVLLYGSIFFKSCATSNKVENKVKKAKKEQPSSPLPHSTLAPGTARILAEVLSHKELNQRRMCEILIKKVLEYGSTTPPLPIGTKLEIEISKTFVDKNETRLSEILKESQPVELTIRFQKQVMFGETLSRWFLIQGTSY